MSTTEHTATIQAAIDKRLTPKWDPKVYVGVDVLAREACIAIHGFTHVMDHGEDPAIVDEATAILKAMEKAGTVEGFTDRRVRCYRLPLAA